jgi:hypothetical protein
MFGNSQRQRDQTGADYDRTPRQQMFGNSHRRCCHHGRTLTIDRSVADGSTDRDDKLTYVALAVLANKREPGTSDVAVAGPWLAMPSQFSRTVRDNVRAALFFPEF